MKQLFILLIIFLSNEGYSQEKAQEAYSAGVDLLNANKFTEAETQFKIAIDEGKVAEGLKMSNIYMGFALNGQSKFKEAIPFFNRAIELDPEDPASYIDRALAYAYHGDNQNSKDDFNHVLKLDSIGEQAEAAYYYLGRIASSEQDNKTAIEHYDQLIQLVPTDAEAYFLRGTAKSNLFEHRGAIEDYDNAIKYNPQYMEAYANRGVAKVNLVPMNEKMDKNLKCLEDPCSDLLTADSMGDTTVGDMIYLYCKKCK